MKLFQLFFLPKHKKTRKCTNFIAILYNRIVNKLWKNVKMNNRCFKVFLFIFIYSFAFILPAQEKPELVKAAILYQITKNITWPKSDKKEFIITIYGNDELMYQYLGKIEQQRLRGLPIKRYQSTEINFLKSSHVVYVSASYQDQVRDLAKILRNSSTLLITDNSDAKADLMINLMINDGKVNFQVNRANILNEGLIIGEDLLFLGGTELDVRDIYREMLTKLQVSEEELKTSQQQVNQAKQKLASLDAQVTQGKQQIKQQEQQLMLSQKRFKAAEEQLIIKNKEFVSVLAQYDQLKLNVDQVNSLLNNKLMLLDVQKSKYNQLLSDVGLGQKELASLESQIKEKNQLLSSQSAELDIKSQKIEQQQYTLMTVITIAFVILIAASFISVLFIQYKRMANKLSESNENLKATQKQLVESEKFASLGQLIAGVAHELNTPLSIAITSASFIQDRAQSCNKKIESGTLKKSDIVNFFVNIEKAQELATHNLQRCVDLISSFKQVSTDQTISQQRDILIKDYISEIMKTLAIALKKNRVNWQVKGDNPTVYLDPGFLAQVINNLVMNAVIHAFDGIEDKQLTLAIAQKDECIIIDIIDNGIGMNENTLTHLFDPFFTTKRSQGGTGLGMNIVYNLVVQNMAGEISASSIEHQGTKISIQLPLRIE